MVALPPPAQPTVDAIWRAREAAHAEDGQRTGSTMAAFIDDACIVISMALQHGIAPAALARSLSTVPVWQNGVKGEGPASPVGAILAALEPAPALPWAAT